MTGLKRGKVLLCAYDSQWKSMAENTINLLKNLLGDAAPDIQHIGSTAIPCIHAKPVIDIIAGMNAVENIMPYVEILASHGIFFHREAIKGQLLFVCGDLDKEIVTHHIHIVRYGSEQWKNYVNFRDYLIAFPQRAKEYDELKMRLASLYADDRKSYTAGKERMIGVLLQEAAAWRMQNGSECANH